MEDKQLVILYVGKAKDFKKFMENPSMTEEQFQAMKYTKGSSATQ